MQQYTSAAKLGSRGRTDGKLRLGGYTLTELLVVLTIIGLVAAALTPGILASMNTAKARTARIQMDNIAIAIELFLADIHRVPSTEEGLAALTTMPDQMVGWTGPYLSQKSKKTSDPWGNEYQYTGLGQQEYTLVCLGADGKIGGSGPNADIVHD